MGESSWTLVNSLSKHADGRQAELQEFDDSALSLKTNRGHLMELNLMEHEDSVHIKEDLLRMTELMDGFKASKVFCG